MTDGGLAYYGLAIVESGLDRTNSLLGFGFFFSFESKL